MWEMGAEQLAQQFTASAAGASEWWQPVAALLIAGVTAVIGVAGYLRLWGRRTIRWHVSGPERVTICQQRYPQAPSDPYVVRISFDNHCRDALTPEGFEGSEPIAVSLGVPILDVSMVESTPASVPVPPLPRWEGDRLLVGPMRLLSKQAVQYTVLTSGKPRDNEIRSGLHKFHVSPRRRTPRPELLGGAVAVFGVTLGVLIAIWPR